MKKRTDRGFSLIEIVVALAIMAVLVGILTPQYLRYVKKTRKANDIAVAREIGNALNVLAVDDPVMKDYIEICQADAKNNCNSTSRYYHLMLFASTSKSAVPYSMKVNRFHGDKVTGYNETELNNHIQDLFEKSLGTEDVEMKFLEKNTRDQWIITVDKGGRFHVHVGGGINGWQPYISNTGAVTSNPEPCYELWPNTSEDYNDL